MQVLQFRQSVSQSVRALGPSLLRAQGHLQVPVDLPEGVGPQGLAVRQGRQGLYRGDDAARRVHEEQATYVQVAAQ